MRWFYYTKSLSNLILHAHIFALNHNQQDLRIQVAWPGLFLCNIVYEGHQMPRPHYGSSSSWLAMTKWFLGTSFIFFRSQQLLWGGSLPQYLAYLSQHLSGQVAAHCLVFTVWKTCLMHRSVLYSPVGLRGKGTVVVICCNLFAVLLLECRVFCRRVVCAGGCTGCGPSGHDMNNLFLNAAAGSGPSLLIWTIS